MLATAANKQSAEKWIRNTASRDDGRDGNGHHKKGSWGGNVYVGGIWGGQTATGPATAYALRWKQNMKVVLLTDGAPNCPQAQIGWHLKVIAGANTQGASIDVFGIQAFGSYRAFCQKVAAMSGGSYHDVN